MDPIVENLAIASTFSILIPILFCLRVVMRKAEKHLQLFLLFLILGFITDLLGWISYKASVEGMMLTIIDMLYQIYPAIEAICFFWVIGYFSNRKLIQAISKYSLWLTIPAWLLVKLLIGDQVRIAEINVDVFPAIYRIVCSFLSSFVLLELIEDGETKLHEQYPFWILSAILFYCFSTFFVLFLGKEYGEKLWYLHNTMNIITYLFYSVGFHFYKKYPQHTKL